MIFYELRSVSAKLAGLERQIYKCAFSIYSGWRKKIMMTVLEPKRKCRPHRWELSAISFHAKCPVCMAKSLLPASHRVKSRLPHQPLAWVNTDGSINPLTGGYHHPREAADPRPANMHSYRCFFQWSSLTVAKAPTHRAGLQESVFTLANW